MFRLFQSVISRVKAMFTLDAMLDLEKQFVTRHAERRAELIRSADRYEQEGLTAIAADLRCQAETLSEQRPLQTVVPFLTSEPESPPSPAVPRRLEDRRDRRPKLPHLTSTHSPQRSKGK